MINKLEISNFKSIKYFQFHLRELNILTGLNSSGKSSVIQALRMLEQHSFGKELYLEGHGDIRDLTNVESDEKFNLYVEGITNEESFNLDSDMPIGNDYPPYPKVIYTSASRIGGTVAIPMNNSYDLGIHGENVLKCIDYYNEHYKPYPNGLSHSGEELGALRLLVNDWLQAITPGLNMGFDCYPEMDTSRMLFNDRFRASNVGFGLSYTLSVIVALFIGVAERNSIVLIENPEAHVHPKGQTELGRLICLCANAGAQIVVETHSDHLFDGVRVFAKENNGFCNKVRPYWFELNKGETFIEPLEIDNDGRMKKWPKGMFDQFMVNANKLM